MTGTSHDIGNEWIRGIAQERDESAVQEVRVLLNETTDVIRNAASELFHAERHRRQMPLHYQANERYMNDTRKFQHELFEKLTISFSPAFPDLKVEHASSRTPKECMSSLERCL